MRLSEFWSVMDEVFGPGYARSLASDLTLSALDGRSAQQALDAGVAPGDVWNAVCDATEQTEAVRWLHRAAKPKRR